MSHPLDALLTPVRHITTDTGGTVYVYASSEEASRAAAHLVYAVAQATPEAFHMALSGGGTPQRLHEILGADDALPWARTHLYWSDDRFVPHDDPASNVAPVRATITDRVAIPPSHIHPVDTEAATPEAAADAYDALLRDTFGDVGATTFDVSIMGLGQDGHTASLFPEDFEAGPPTAHAGRHAVAVYGPPRRPPRERVTLTLGALDAARYTVFLAFGEGKRDALRAAISGTTVPAGRVRAREALVWLVDKAIAEGIGA